MHRSWILGLLTLPITAACGGGRAPEALAPASGTSADITPADLKRRTLIFADDSMGGRILDSRGEPVRGALVEIWQCDSNAVYFHSRGGAPEKNTYIHRVGRWLKESF